MGPHAKTMECPVEFEIWKGMFRLNVYCIDDDGRRALSYRIVYTPSDFFETIYGQRGALAAIRQFEVGGDIVPLRKKGEG